jgi:hypothetical protein
MIVRGTRRYWLKQIHEASCGGKLLSFDDPDAAERFLSGCLGEWQSMRSLRRVLIAQSNHDPSRLKDQQVLRSVARWISSGLVRVFELPAPDPTRMSPGVRPDLPEEPVVPPKEVPPEKEAPQTFKLAEVIEFVKRSTEGSVAGAAAACTSGAYPQLVERTAKDGAAYKQYINLAKDLEGASKVRPEYGRYIELRARIEWASGDKSRSLAGKKVHWSYTIEKHSGGKRPDALNGSQKAGFTRANGSDTLVSSTDAAGWTAPVKFYLTQYAGDRFTVFVQADVDENGKPSGDRRRVGPYAVWRKFWYQITHAAGKSIAAPDRLPPTGAWPPTC